VGGTALKSKATNSFEARGLSLWIRRAINSLPVPVSPVIRTATSAGATRSTSRQIRSNAALRLFRMRPLSTAICTASCVDVPMPSRETARALRAQLAGQRPSGQRAAVSNLGLAIGTSKLEVASIVPCATACQGGNRDTDKIAINREYSDMDLGPRDPRAWTASRLFAKVAPQP